MHTAAPASVEPSNGRDDIERHAVASPDADIAHQQRAADLHLVMDLAERYARQLVAATESPPDVLLLVHQGDLELITLDSPHAETRTLPGLLAQRRASTAALLVDIGSGIDGQIDHRFSIVGETVDGVRAERHYRVRPCGRTRRLTRLLDHDTNEARCLAPRLFLPQTALNA